MKKGAAEIVCTGSELLGGKLNLYVPLFSSLLSSLGFSVKREQSCGDSIEEIRDCLAGALKRADLVIACGGLGPTFDDLTRQAAGAVLGRKLFYSEDCARILRFNYGLKTLPGNFRNQCLLVEGAKALENTCGTAFGQVLTRGRKMLVLLPGPRREWEPMFANFLNSEIADFFRLPALARAWLRAAGLKETEAEALLKPVMAAHRRLDFTLLAGPGIIDFIIRGDDSRGEVARAEAAARRALGRAFFGGDADTLAGAAGKKLLESGKTLATAESCTGGLVSKLITDLPGSSSWFIGGCAAYSNSVKSSVLGVKASTLKLRGAVSAECAREMAEGARRRFSSDYALSVTGIAGPDGAAPGKPVGLVWFGLASPGRTLVFRRVFKGGRDLIRERAANFVLDELRKIIK